jgi:hypothetical protein
VSSLAAYRARLGALLREKRYLEERIAALAAVETDLCDTIGALQTAWQDDFDGWYRQASEDDLDEFRWMLNRLAGRDLTRATFEMQLEATWEAVWRDSLIAQEVPDVPHRELA